MGGKRGCVKGAGKCGEWRSVACRGKLSFHLSPKTKLRKKQEYGEGEGGVKPIPGCFKDQRVDSLPVNDIYDHFHQTDFCTSDGKDQRQDTRQRHLHKPAVSKINGNFALANNNNIEPKCKFGHLTSRRKKVTPELLGVLTVIKSHSQTSCASECFDFFFSCPLQLWGIQVQLLNQPDVKHEQNIKESVLWIGMWICANTNQGCELCKLPFCN